MDVVCGSPPVGPHKYYLGRMSMLTAVMFAIFESEICRLLIIYKHSTAVVAWLTIYLWLGHSPEHIQTELQNMF